MDRYKEALEKARNLVKAGLIYEDTAIQMFPELKDGKNKEDEKIIKALINLVNNYPSMDFFLKYDIHLYEVIDWLKKQGEQKPIMNVPTREVILSIWDLGNEWKELTNGSISTEYGTQLDYIQKHWHESEYYLRVKQGKQKLDKVESKFHEGDWIVFNGLTLLINEVVPGYYRTTSIGGIHNSYDWDIDNAARSWTIKDAKDGDVLVTEPIEGYYSPFVAIYKKQNEEDFNSYCFIGFDGKFYKGENGHSTEEIHPATKEQCDLLFSKMKEAGYTFDFKKKEQKEIIDEKQIKKNLQDNNFRRMFE